MTQRRFGIWDLIFLLVLLVSPPAAVFHLSQGRYAQAFIAVVAFGVGLVALVWSLTREPVVEAPHPPRPPHRRRPRRQPQRDAEGRVQDWLAVGVLSGFVATAVMTVTFLFGYGFAAVFASSAPDAGFLATWFDALINNPLTRATQSNLPAAIALHFVAGIVWAVVYTGLVEPRLHGPGWRRGLIFAVVPWLFSLFVFLPVVGGGFLGLAIDAGPLPIIGNLILHAAYGVTLGEVTVAEGLMSEGDRVRDPAEPAALSHVQRMIALAVVPGLLIGAVVGLLTAPVVAPGFAPASVAVVGAVVGCVTGVLLGSFSWTTSGPEEA